MMSAVTLISLSGKQTKVILVTVHQLNHDYYRWINNMSMTDYQMREVPDLRRTHSLDVVFAVAGSLPCVHPLIIILNEFSIYCRNSHKHVDASWKKL